MTMGGNGPVIEAGLGADVAVFSLSAAFVVTSFSTAVLLNCRCYPAEGLSLRL